VSESPRTQTPAAVTVADFDAQTLEHLRGAAEEVAWLVGRGYPLEPVRNLVQKQHALSALQLRAVERGMCSDGQYRRHAARELDPEDVAKRPLRIDGFNVLGTVAVALAEGLLVQAPDGTLRDLDWVRGGRVEGDLDDTVLTRIGAAVKTLRPSKSIVYLDAQAPGVDQAQARLLAAGKKWRGGVEVVVVDGVAQQLGKSAGVASGDPDVLDRCGTWFNLPTYVFGTLPDGVLRLQGV